LSSPYRFTRAYIAHELDQAKADPEGFHGARIKLAAPDMPTMGLTVERLTGGANTRRYRTTANTIFHVMEGSGHTTIGNKHFAWTRGDTIAAPCWHTITHQATADAQLFVLSDEPLLRFSNYYRFEAMD
jgi:gentisate 1,2-dioxygenase